MQQKAGASRAADWWPGRRENAMEQLCPGAWTAVHQSDRGYPHLLRGCCLPGGLYIQLQTGVFLPCFPSSLQHLPRSVCLLLLLVCGGGGTGEPFFKFVLL